MSTEKTSRVDEDASATRVFPGRPQGSAGDTAAQPSTGPGGARPAAAREPAGPSGAPAAATSGDDTNRGETQEGATSEGEGRTSRWRRAFGTSRPATEAHVPTPEEAEQAAAAAAAAAARTQVGPRRVRLAISRVDPWSVMKLAFLLSIAIGIALVIATAVVWNVLNTMQVFTQADGIVTDIAGTESFIDILDYVQFSRVISIAVVIAVVDVVILTAIATLFAFLYNVTAALVGGLHVTLTDE